VIVETPQLVFSKNMSTSPNTLERVATATDRSKLASAPNDSAAPTGDSKNIEVAASRENKNAIGSTGEQAGKSNYSKREGHLSPPSHQQSNSYGVQVYPHLTPQSRGAYYNIGYQSQVTPEPPSPAGPGVSYDMSTFFQQPPATFAPHNSPFGVPNTPGSPHRNNGSLSVIPPASPLFPMPRATNIGGAAGIVPTGSIDQQLLMDSAQAQGHHPTGGSNLSVPYLQSPPLGPASMYQSYPINGIASQSESPEEISTWNDRRNQQNNFQQNSPQINAQGIPMSYVTGMARTNVPGQPGQQRTISYEGGGESMLPPSAIDQQENPIYSQYGSNQNGSGGTVGGTLFAHQHPWAYPGQGDMYGNPGSPLQPRPAGQMPVYPAHNLGGALRPMSLYGQYYPATSPGPPIQTTDCNKGPDGANLFIFHIPNHFTNNDMYQLFCPYGNLLSVRIMVEKDTGRSRGFGFVSYDSPESAAHAIKELNGFAIGNKRLKVQHKQIRPSDQQSRDNTQGVYTMNAAGANSAHQRSPYGSHLPPSGAMAAAQSLPATSPWYESGRGTGLQSSAVAEMTAKTQDSQELERNAAVGVVDNNNVTGNALATDNNGISGPTLNNTSPSTGNILTTTEGSSGLSPLTASLEPLRNALPDVSS